MEVKVNINLTTSESQELRSALKNARHYLREYSMKIVTEQAERDAIGRIHNKLKEFGEKL